MKRPLSDQVLELQRDLQGLSTGFNLIVSQRDRASNAVMAVMLDYASRGKGVRASDIIRITRQSIDYVEKNP